MKGNQWHLNLLCEHLPAYRLSVQLRGSGPLSMEAKYQTDASKYMQHLRTSFSPYNPRK